MIWKNIHINEDAASAQDFLSRLISSQKNSWSKTNVFFTVGIVGGGPKGLYALEELGRRIRKEEINDTWRILWFNNNVDFGSGSNYQVQQPDYLLINYCIAHVDAWESVEARSQNHLNLMDWITKYKTNATKVKPTDFASRALVGKYLQYTAMQVLKEMPANVRVQLISEKVDDVKAEANGELVIQTHINTFSCKNVLLCTGHCYNNLPLVKFNNDPIHPNYISNAYPLKVLDQIPPKSKVGIIGWGLTFIDSALHLTEGRGGQFDKNYNYISGANEPVLLPFSRNQLPILPRGAIYGSNVYSLQYLTPEWFVQIKAIAKGRQISFITEILPWLEKELSFAYYSTLLQNQNKEDVETYITSLPVNDRFTYHDLLFPTIPKKTSLQESYIQYVQFLISEAERGPLISPIMAAASVWREASSMIADLYNAAGFTGESQKYLDTEMFSALCRTSYGPPIENMKKILALMKADIIQIHFEEQVQITHVQGTDQFTLATEQQRRIVDFIIDARIARPNLNAGNSQLYCNLLSNGLVQPFNNQQYKPGCIDIINHGQIAVTGKNIPLYAYGTATEGFLLDNDSLSRKKNNLAKYWASETVKQQQQIYNNVQ